MADILVAIIIAIFIFYCIAKYFERRKLKQPPGPWCLPILGYLPFLGREPFRTFIDLSQKYGNVFSLRLGSTPVVVCNDYESVKESLNNPSLLHRPPHFFDFHPGDLGYVSTSGAEWIEQRRHSLKYLKEYGLTNLTWQENVSAELEEYISALVEYAGEPVDVCNILSVSVSNNMLSLMLGRRIPAGDPQKHTVKDANDALAIVFVQTGASRFFPKFAKYLAKMGISSLAENYKKMDTLHTFLKNEVNFRKKISDWREDVFIDNYLKEMEIIEDRSHKSYFSEHNLIGNIQGMIHGGSETTRTSLQWLFLAMAAFQDVQVKIHEEIDRVLGPEGKCEFSERRKLPYTYATVMEGQRWRSVAALNLTHRASEDTMIGKFHIPKGTFIITNLWALHYDSNYWENPEVFEPKRFLLEDGNLNPKEQPSYLPFSGGRRICPGRSMAMMEVFKYFTATVQKFHILPLEDHSPNLTGINGITYHPHPQMLRYKIR